MTHINDIRKLMYEELNSANEVYPLFHSSHEAYAVILEELEELEEEVDKCKVYLDKLWNDARRDDMRIDVVNSLKSCAMFASMEAIQVAAMCQKAIDSELTR